MRQSGMKVTLLALGCFKPFLGLKNENNPRGIGHRQMTCAFGGGSNSRYIKPVARKRHGKGKPIWSKWPKFLDKPR